MRRIIVRVEPPVSQGWPWARVKHARYADDSERAAIAALLCCFTLVAHAMWALPTVTSFAVNAKQRWRLATAAGCQCDGQRAVASNLALAAAGRTARLRPSATPRASKPSNLALCRHRCKTFERPRKERRPSAVFTRGRGEGN
jgi:hypothetical protein